MAIFDNDGVERHCRGCGKLLVRRIDESPSHFILRANCNAACSDTYRGIGLTYDDDAIAVRFTAGDPVRQIMERFGCSKSHVHKVLSDRGIATQRKTSTPVPRKEDRVKALARSLATQVIIPVDAAERIVRAVAICCRRVPEKESTDGDVHDYGEAQSG